MAQTNTQILTLIYTHTLALTHTHTHTHTHYCTSFFSVNVYELPPTPLLYFFAYSYQGPHLDNCICFFFFFHPRPPPPSSSMLNDKPVSLLVLVSFLSTSLHVPTFLIPRLFVSFLFFFCLFFFFFCVCNTVAWVIADSGTKPLGPHLMKNQSITDSLVHVSNNHDTNSHATPTARNLNFSHVSLPGSFNLIFSHSSFIIKRADTSGTSDLPTFTLRPCYDFHA